jgi:hypothetical protein
MGHIIRPIMRWQCLIIAAVVAVSSCRAVAAPGGYVATDVTSKTIYHSPQSPGFTCWVGAWIMPDKSMMVSLTQATGPLKDRPRTDPKTLAHFPGWPPNGNANYDMNGLDLRNV